MINAPISQLELHSYFSFLGGTASPKALVAQAAADQLPYLALTDTNGLHGAVAFSQACHRTEIKPITGLTVYLRPTLPTEQPGKLVLLATGPIGYRSLCRISACLQGSRKREHLLRQGLEWSTLAENQAGLICLSGGRFGFVNQALRANNIARAKAEAERLAHTFGERCYLSLEIHDQTDERCCPQLVNLADQLGIGTVAVQPVYTINPADQPRLKLLTAIDHNCLLTEVPAFALPHGGDPSVDLSWQSPAKLKARFALWPDALNAIATIATQCQPALPTGIPIWPTLPLPKSQTPAEALRSQAIQGLATRYPSPKHAGLTARLEYELTLIIDRGYAPLFLIVADIVRFARTNNVPVSTRGSVANSLVAYVLQITTVDPIEHQLLFERFLNPARADPPDIDLDFCSRRRDRVLNYVRQTYGEEKVALVGTISTMQPKSAVREVGKAYGLAEAQIKQLTKLLPRGHHPDPQRREKMSLANALNEVEDHTEKTVLREAYALINQPHHLSLHPGGLVITPGPLTDVVPVQMSPKGFLATQYDHHDVERIGLQKIDLLGISALTVLADAAELIQANDDPTFRLDHIPADDLATANCIAAGETVGVFQCESTGARSTLIKLKARNVADLAVANAFFKPGPAMGGMADHFVRRYKGEQAVTYLHPSLAPVLAESMGVLLFQEQVLRVATEIAGLSWADADFIRRGISKFRNSQVQHVRETFIQGCTRIDGPGLNQRQAETLWDQISAFAGYGFNKGHATAYAAISYQMAYLKTHYPAPFLAARLQTHGGFHNQAIYLAEAKALGLACQPPHVNMSNRKFRLVTTAEGQETLWMGLAQVRDLRRASVKAIIAARHNGPFTSVRNLLQRVALQPKEIEHLIKVGALDGLGPHRAAMLVELDEINRAGNVQQMGFDFGQPQLSAEPASQRLAWELALLGLPVSINPLKTETSQGARHPGLNALIESPGSTAEGDAYPMPGWTGGRGFFISDGEIYFVARMPDYLKRPDYWQPFHVRGCLIVPEAGTPWIQIEQCY